MEQRIKLKTKKCFALKANKLTFSVGQRRDNFVLGSLITSSELLNESHSAITHGRGSCDTVKSYTQRRGGQHVVQNTLDGAHKTRAHLSLRNNYSPNQIVVQKGNALKD